MENSKKKHQDPITIDEQINNLKKLNLHISNEEYARKILSDISYFRLVKAYSITLKKKNSNYHPGVEFNDLVDLYKFNSELRQLLFPIIERIEINLRCRIINYFSLKYGNFGYEDCNNFNDFEFHKKNLKELRKEVKRNRKSPFVKNFIDNYEEAKLPMNAILELSSFGTLSKLYKNMKSEDKKNIAKFYGIGYTYLESWFENFAYIRNICAHYERLYFIKIPKAPKIYKEYADNGVQNFSIFATFVNLSLIFNNEEFFENYINNLDNLIKKYPVIKIDKMGFVNDWRKVLLDKNYYKK